MSKVAFLGCSRGLGRAVLDKWDRNDNVLLVSRKIELLQKVAREFAHSQIRQCDLTNEGNLADLVELLIQSEVQKIFYFAGGGPHGLFEQKKWTDHEWAFKLNFLSPLKILHTLMREGTLKQFVVVGSSVAENNPEPLGTSYAAAKKAIKGAIESLNARDTQLPFNLQIFSPGYMDTDLLPANAEPRKAGLARSPIEVATEFIVSVSNPH